MRVLLTGATGFVGRYVERELDRQGVEYFSFQRSVLSDDRAVQIDLLNQNDLVGLLKKIRPTHLVHTAWYAEHGKYWDSDLNIQWISATKRLVEAFCAAGGQHVVITGTCAEYDWEHGYCIEDITPTIPRSLYGISKDTTRRIIDLVVESYGVSMSWARIFYPYGPGEAPQRLIPSLFRALRGEVLPFGVNGGSYRDLLHVEDTARAILACARSRFAGCVNVCSGRPVQICDIVRTVANINGADPEVVLGISPANHESNRFLVGANKKLLSLGWTQEILLGQGLLGYTLGGSK
jgi:nucleoside-diphosphate-sugar epimerase